MPLLPASPAATNKRSSLANGSDQIEFLGEIVEDFHSGLNKSIPFTAIAESAFALLYLRKGVDIIPDNIPRIGYTDDAAIINSVFENYKQPFLKHVLAKNTGNTVEQDSV